MVESVPAIACLGGALTARWYFRSDPNADSSEETRRARTASTQGVPLEKFVQMVAGPAAGAAPMHQENLDVAPFDWIHDPVDPQQVATPRILWRRVQLAYEELEERMRRQMWRTVVSLMLGGTVGAWPNVIFLAFKPEFACAATLVNVIFGLGAYWSFTRVTDHYAASRLQRVKTFEFESVATHRARFPFPWSLVPIVGASLIGAALGFCSLGGDAHERRQVTVLVASEVVALVIGRLLPRREPRPRKKPGR